MSPTIEEHVEEIIIVGKTISNIEINISAFGIWLLCQDQEYFLPHEQFPWFKGAKVSALYNIELIHHHLHWPELDIDLHLDSLTNVKKYPLIYLS